MPPAPRTTHLLGLIAVVATVVGVGMGVDKLVLPNLFPKRFGVVAAGKIYRSGELTPAALAQVAQRYGLRTIIDLGADPAGSPDDIRAQRTAQALGLTRFRFQLEGDARGNPNNYVQALRVATDPAHQPVLIHCSAGTQRTGCAIALYREIYEHQSREAALAEARQYDHDPRDNPHLRGMLDQFGGAIAEALVNGGQIPTEPALPPPVPVPPLPAER